MRFIFLLAIIGLFFSSCDSDRLYEFNKDFQDRAWKTNDTVVFDFKINDIRQKYNIYYSVRNSIDYPYARLFVNYSLTDTLGNQLVKKLTTQDLFDQKTGKPNGTSGLGDIYDHRFLLLSNYEFNHQGKFVLKLEQYMRQDTLPGILAAGVRVEKATPASTK
jgi:gliding motility-associated lipoprotein GldH